MLALYSLLELMEFAVYISQNPRAIIRHFPESISMDDDLLKPIMEEKLAKEAAAAAKQEESTPVDENKAEAMDSEIVEDQPVQDDMITDDGPSFGIDFKEQSQDQPEGQVKETPNKDLTAANDEDNDLSEEDITLVMSQANTSKDEATKALIDHKKNVIEAIRGILEETDIKNIMFKADVGRDEAIKALRDNDHNLFNALKALKMNTTQE